MKTRKFRVGTENTNVHYGLLEEINQLIDLKDALWVADENTKRYLPEFSSRRLILSSGEQHKTLDSLRKILDAAIEYGFARDSQIVALGGGVICDMVGFAASIYMRGCGVILIPSTLLSINDASLGGKTAIDYHGYKNLLGAFYPASDIYIFTDIVNSLNERDYHSGLAEILKHGFLGNKDLHKILVKERDLVLKRDASLLQKIIPLSLNTKGEIVESDAKEKNIRAFLNLGHTFGHALETVSNFSILHGEGVAWGIGMAMNAGVELGITDPVYAQEVNDLLLAYQYKLKYDSIDKEQLLQAMTMDKKKKGGKVRFVLQRKQGDNLLTEISSDILRRIL